MEEGEGEDQAEEDVDIEAEAGGEVVEKKSAVEDSDTDFAGMRCIQCVEYTYDL